MSRPLLRPRDLVLAGVTGGLTLVDPARCRGWRLRAYRLATGGLTTVTTHDVLDDPELSLSPRVRAGAALAVGAAVTVSLSRLERMDARTQRWLVRRGVSHPRVVLAVLATGSYLVTAVFDERARRRAAGDDDPA